jgi:hypothetical protein
MTANKNAHGFFQACRALVGHLENLLQRRGGVMIAAFALIYYGLYFNAHITLTGEAGSNVLIAQRMQEGWRPIKDMFIGYNLMWFFPLSWIFEFTGPHLLASRVYFLVLCGISAVLGFLVVRRVTGQAIVAGVAGVLMVLMPGAMYRNNVGFVGCLASFALVYGYIVSHRSWLSIVLWMGFAGAAMSLCFLIRIEPSLLASVVWIGLVVLYPFAGRGGVMARLLTVIAGTTLALVMFAAVHAPFVAHAYRAGFGPEFVGQYSQFVNLLRWELQKELRKIPSAPEKKPSAIFAQNAIDPFSKPSDALPATKPAKSRPAEANDGRRQRPPFAESFQSGRISYFPLSIYFPVFTAAVLALAGGLFFLGGAIVRNPDQCQIGLAVLATTGCALALFPQYFFFRPDSVHLAEFMVPFYPALGCAAVAGISLAKKTRWMAFCGLALVVVVLLQVVVAFNSLFGRDGSGSIRIARGRTALFEAPGGIRFRVKKDDLADWERLRDTLARSSRPGEYLVTFPYVPLLNVMADRPSYQFKLYVDNATEPPDFSEKTIRELREKRPAVVVVNNRDINKTEFSRFKNWASPVHDFLQSDYVPQGTFFEDIEVFVRPDRVAPSAE